MAYAWPRNLCNGKGVPYEKMPSVYLEKTDEGGNVIASDTFTTQETVDLAWANGFHSPGKPETRDCMPAPPLEPEDITAEAPPPGPESEPGPEVMTEDTTEEDKEEDKEEEGPTIYCCGDCDFDTLSEHGLKVHRATKHKE